MQSHVNPYLSEKRISKVAISIVIVNSDGGTLTKDCLSSLYTFPPSSSFEVIVVDNCSKDGFIQEAAQEFPSVQIVSSPVRQGFSKNYNLGIRHSRGEIIIAINNDTLFHANFFIELERSIKTHNWSLCGPRLLEISGRIQFGTILPQTTIASHSLFTLLVGPGSFFAPLFLPLYSLAVRLLPECSVPAISGACMIFRREALENLGAFNEEFEFYFEDVELCHRYRTNGIHIGYIPKAHITHLGNASLGKVRFLSKTSEYKSAKIYFEKHKKIGRFGAIILWLITFFCFFQRYGLLYLLSLTNSSKYSTPKSEYRNLLEWIWIQRKAI